MSCISLLSLCNKSWYLNAKIIIIQKSHVSNCDFSVFFLVRCFLSWLSLTADIWTCHNRKSTGVTNNINDVPVPFKCTCGYVSEASMCGAVAPRHWHRKWNAAIDNIISYTCVWHFRGPAVRKVLSNITHTHTRIPSQWGKKNLLNFTLVKAALPVCRNKSNACV